MTGRETSIRCARFRAHERAVARLTAQINTATTAADRAPLAQELADMAEEILSCDEYDEKSLGCACCRNLSELRRQTARLILKAATLAD